jgi:acetyl-CoA acetyltransferase
MCLSSGFYKRQRTTPLFRDTGGGKTGIRIFGYRPEDVDVAEVHDCFSISELIHYEDLGFCKKVKVENDRNRGTDINGKVAVSPSGGC